MVLGAQLDGKMDTRFAFRFEGAHLAVIQTPRQENTQLQQHVH